MFRDRLAAEFAPYAALSDEQLGRLQGHYELLVKWNQSLNLTRIVDIDDAVKLHYCESLFVGHALPAGSLRIVDVGTGAGFPGIPLAILRPECSVTLVESHRRKAVFLREASRLLSNVKIISDRAEWISGDWDWCVSRAVRPTDVLGFGLAGKHALLISSADFVGLPEPVVVRQVPWGTDRVLAEFHVEHQSSVSRGTRC